MQGVFLENPSSATDISFLNEGHGNVGGTFQLDRAFTALVKGLEQTIVKPDHTYAHAVQKTEKGTSVRDAVICKDADLWSDRSNDHNYSSSSKTTPRGRQQFRKFYELSEETRRSSSEENVSHNLIVSTVSDENYKNVPKMNTRKCHSVEEMASDKVDNISSKKNSSLFEVPKKSTPSRQRKNKQLKLCKELEVISNSGIGNLKISSKAHTMYKGRKRCDGDSETVIPAQVRDHSYGKVSDAKTLPTRSTNFQSRFKLHGDHTYSGVICQPGIWSEPCNCGDANAEQRAKNTSDRLQFQKDHTYSFKSMGSKIA